MQRRTRPAQAGKRARGRPARLDALHDRQAQRAADGALARGAAQPGVPQRGLGAGPLRRVLVQQGGHEVTALLADALPVAALEVQPVNQDGLPARARAGGLAVPARAACDRTYMLPCNLPRSPAGNRQPMCAASLQPSPLPAGCKKLGGASNGSAAHHILVMDGLEGQRLSSKGKRPVCTRRRGALSHTHSPRGDLHHLKGDLTQTRASHTGTWQDARCIAPVKDPCRMWRMPRRAAPCPSCAHQQLVRHDARGPDVGLRPHPRAQHLWRHEPAGRATGAHAHAGRPGMNISTAADHSQINQDTMREACAAGRLAALLFGSAIPHAKVRDAGRTRAFPPGRVP